MFRFFLIPPGCSFMNEHDICWCTVVRHVTEGYLTATSSPEPEIIYRLKSSSQKCAWCENENVSQCFLQFFKTIFTQKLLVNFPNSYKEINIELNVKFWSRKSETVYIYNNISVIYNLKTFYSVKPIVMKTPVDCEMFPKLWNQIYTKRNLS